MAEETEHPDSFRDPGEPRSSKAVWDAICDARKEFEPYWDVCDRIDAIVSAGGAIARGRPSIVSDQEFDLFWASLEIIKPAVYAKPPQPVVSPRFADRNKVAVRASELLERCLVSSFERGDFDQVMLNIRDDLIISGRGVSRVTYEAKDGQRVCDDHVDRCDFLHEPARKWSEVGWVAFAAYLSQSAMEERFKDVDLSGAQYLKRGERNTGNRIGSADKCRVWEVWHKNDNRVYWVTEGVDTFLDEQAPFLAIEGFFPCPRPAFGTLQRRSLIPVPDYIRYENHLAQINELTRRIYSLLEWVKVKGLFPAGGDVGNAVETALKQAGDDVILIPVPGMALIQGSGQFVQFLPLQEFASAIQGLLEARREMISNFYELSGISDIMRGATEAEETLGAQQLKSQYGSVRVREKIDELQRVARDVARISAEIIAEKFSEDTIFEMAQMEIPTKAEIKKQIKDMEEAAKKELDELAKNIEQMAQGGEQQDPQAIEQQFQQQQQAILQKYEPMIAQAAEVVPREDVIALLRDQKTRGFSIDIETDSTIMTDELAEKASRAEFLTAFANATAAVQPLLAAGESGAKLAGAMLKFALAPFRVGRELDGMIDDFIENAPKAFAQQEGGEAEKAMAEANQKIAEAEIQKAQAAIAKVQVDAQSKMQEMQLRGAEAQAKAQADQQRVALEMQQTRGTIAETDARIKKIEAEIQKMGVDASNQVRKEDREDVKVSADIQMRQRDQAMSAQDRQRAAFESDRDAAMGERQQSFSERQGERAESRADRQQEFVERQPVK